MAGPIRILIADDEPGIRRSLADILIDEGYAVSTAEDGAQAVAQCAREPFDVVLLDLRMPGLDGVEALRRIRRHRAGLRIFLMSGYGSDEEFAARAGDPAISPEAILRKPLDLDHLLGLLEQVRGGKEDAERG